MNMVMPNARILAGVNATSSRSSPFGQFLIAKVSLLGAEYSSSLRQPDSIRFRNVTEVLAATAAILRNRPASCWCAGISIRIRLGRW